MQFMNSAGVESGGVNLSVLSRKLLNSTVIECDVDVCVAICRVGCLPRDRLRQR